jgi:hypothetical protein
VELDVELLDGAVISWRTAKQMLTEDPKQITLSSFIHLKAQCVSVTVAYDTKARLNKVAFATQGRNDEVHKRKLKNAPERHPAVPSGWAMTIGESIHYITDIRPFDQPDAQLEVARELSGKQLAVRFNRPMSPSNPGVSTNEQTNLQPFIIIVERKSDWWERVGFVEHRNIDDYDFSNLPWSTMSLRLG